MAKLNEKRIEFIDNGFFAVKGKVFILKQ